MLYRSGCGRKSAKQSTYPYGGKVISERARLCPVSTRNQAATPLDRQNVVHVYQGGPAGGTIHDFHALLTPGWEGRCVVATSEAVAPAAERVRPGSALLDFALDLGLVVTSIPHLVNRAEQNRPVIESGLWRYMLERKRPISAAEMTGTFGVSQRALPISGSFQPLKRKRPPGRVAVSSSKLQTFIILQK
jgi:hypothetical protein